MQVIFDTNAYRLLARGKTVDEVLAKVTQMRALEAARGIRAFVSPVVWLELFTHLTDREDPHFSECRAGLKASYLHSRDQGEVRFRMMHWPFMIIAQTIFGFRD